MKRTRMFILMLLSAVFVIYGCSNDSGINSGIVDEEQVPEEQEEPVTITVYVNAATITDIEFQKYYIEPMQVKYPHITLELLRSGKGTAIEDLLAAKTNFPDIIYTSNTSLPWFTDLGLITDLREYVQATNFDLKQIRPAIMESIDLYTNDGSLPALPYSLNFAAWYYNKDILDRFGVNYPVGLMRWEEMLELARSLTRTDDGVNYIGMELDNPDRTGGQMSLPLIDPQTNKALVETDGWKRVFNFIKQNYDLPGYEYGKPMIAGFMQRRDVAMVAAWADQMLGRFEDLHQQGNPIDWDWVALPNFEEYIGTGREVDFHLMILTTLGENKDAAWKVMTHILSDEVQEIVSRSGRLPAVTDPDIEKLFASDLATLTGKNSISNVLKAQPRILHPPHQLDRDVKTLLTAAAKAIAVEKKDVNTALREAQEAADRTIAQWLSGR